MLSITLLMLVLSAFFSGSETAFVASNRLKAVVEAQREGNAGKNVQYFLERPERFLTTTLVGNNIALILYSTLIAVLLEPVIRLVIDVDFVVLICQTILASVIVLLFGEVIPKTLAQQFPNQLLFYIATPLKITYYLFYPIIKISGWVAFQLSKLFNTEPVDMQQFILKDFENLLNESSEVAGENPDKLDKEERILVSNVLSLRSVRVKEAMVPRIVIDALKEDTPIEGIQQAFIQTGRSKLPVYRGSIDNIIGFILVHDLFDSPSQLQDILREVKYVPESKRANELLQEFLETNTSIAIVLDEHGGTAGLVTIEDLLEELIGEIQDEHDKDEVFVMENEDGSFTVSGRAEIDILREEYQLDVPEGDYETIAGLLLDKLGTIPKMNESFQFDGYEFKIIKATPKRIDLLKITPEKE